MISIVEPKSDIEKLWGKQKIEEHKTFRLMKYVLRVDYNKRILLHNAVTGQLAVLDDQEKEVLDHLPGAYTSAMRQLISNHYLVPEDYNEYQQVVNLRTIFRRLESTLPERGINRYTILPTTGCNARCYYCFEQGIKIASMTPQTADNVVDFIASNSKNEGSINITWFGGEPTAVAEIIDRISRGLHDHNVRFRSDMTTNGYLFNEQMVRKAADLWNLEYLQICFDGLESNHNSIKNYVNAKESPYERTLKNIGLLLDRGIRVGMRMNFDLQNHQDFEGLIDEAIARYGNNPALSIYAFPVIGEHKDKYGQLLHGSDQWFLSRIAELNSISRKKGTYHERQILPYLKYHCCDAENIHSITITPDGSLVRCCQCVDEGQRVGTIWDGLDRESVTYKTWNQYADYPKCRDCIYYPYCCRLENCTAGDRCLFYNEWCTRNSKTIIETYERKQSN